MRNYQEFKQTEIGSIPREWEVRRLSEFVDINGESIDPAKDSPNRKFLYVDIDSVENGTGVIRSAKEIVGKDAPSRARRVIHYNDVLMSTVRPYLKALTIVPKKFDNQISSTGFAVLTCRDRIIPLYLLHTLFTKSVMDQCKKMMVGGQYPAITTSQVENIRIPIPPLPEQKKVAEILSTVDQAIEKVDEAIQRTQRLKKGLMQELLTKGIGHKELKDTEIGRIPKEWNVVRISDIADVKGGKRLPKGQKLVNSKTPYPYIRVLDFKNMGVDVSNVQFLLPETHKSIKQYIISSNDVYISIAGTVGIVGLIPSELDNANLTENAAKLCNLRNITKEFLAYFLNSNIGQNQISVYLGKAQQPKLALFRIEKIKVSLPLIPEQQQIAEILSSVDKRLELLRERKERLGKVKKGLMNDLLTGIVRVKL